MENESSKPTPTKLSPDDMALLTKRVFDVIGDKELFRRFTAIHKFHEHPDTGESIDTIGLRADAMKRKRRDDVGAVQNESEPLPTDLTSGPSRASTAIDVFQLGLDAIGVVEPTPIADGANAAISLFRGFISDPSRRQEHLQNAGISAAGIIPYVGDVAKLAKGSRAAKTVQRAAAFQAAGKSANPKNPKAKGAHPWESKSLNEFIDVAKSGANVPVGDAKPDLSAILKKGASPQDAARTFMDSYGGFSGTTGNLDVFKAAEAMDAMRQQARRIDPATLASAGGIGGSPPAGPPPTRPGDPERDPREIDRRIDGQKKLTDLNNDFTEKLTDTVLALGAFGSALVAGVAVVQKVIGINQGYVDSNRYLETYDGGVAASYAVHEVEEMRRNIRKGRKLREAIKKSTEANSRMADVRERFTTPAQEIGMNLSSAGTNVTADVIKVSDNLQGLSSKLEAANTIVGLFTDGISAASNAVASFSEFLTPKHWLRKGFDWWMGDSESGEGSLNQNAPPWAQFLDDVRDGKFDDRGNAGEFFTKDF